MVTAYKKPKQPTQSSYANVRSLTKNTAYAQEQAARSASGGGSSPTVGNPTAPTRANAAAQAKPTMSPTQLAIQTLTQKPNNPTAPTRANAARRNANGVTNNEVYREPQASSNAFVDGVKDVLTKGAKTAMGIVQDAQSVSFNKPPGWQTDMTLAVIPGGKSKAAATGLRRAGVEAVTARTAVSDLTRVGTVGRAKAATSTAGKIATNTASVAATRSWLERLAIASADPRVVAGTLVGAIGSYPFAGFIKEEALQTLGLATTAAVRNDDLEGAQAALDLQREVLNPDVISGIMQAVPFANVLVNLHDFWKAAALKVDVDQRMLDDLRVKTETGETDDAYWARIDAQRQAERDAQRLADEQYYAEIARRQAEAKAAQRAEEEAYWARVFAKKEEEDRRRREEEAAWWAEYYKRQDEIQHPEPSTPSAPRNRGHDEALNSKLNFGIL